MLIMTKDGWRQLQPSKVEPFTKQVAVEDHSPTNWRDGMYRDAYWVGGQTQSFVRNVECSARDGHWDAPELKGRAEAYIHWLVRENKELREARLERHGFDMFSSNPAERRPGFFDKLKKHNIRLKKVEALRDGARTEGERAAAEAAIERIKNL